MIFLLLAGCGGSVQSTSGPTIRYHLDRINTNKMSNYLFITADSTASGYTFSVSGDGIQADVGLSQNVPLKAKTLISYKSQAVYKINVKINASDGQTFINDVLSWEYSLEKPPQPIVTFAAAATSTDTALMILDPSLGPKTVEIWVQGDRGGGKAAGGWITIPANLQVPVVLSDGDGTKNLQVKYRNIFGNESDLVSTKTIRKSISPADCQAVGPAFSASSQYRLNISAQNIGDLFYSVSGDVGQLVPFTKFENSTSPFVSLSAAAGLKTLKIQVKDIAGNLCPDLEVKVTLKAGYQSASTQIANNILWTDSQDVSIVNSYDFLPGDNAEMLITGGVAASSQTLDWVPYAQTVTVQLLPVQGTRFIYTQFRYAVGTETDTIANHIYLRPSVSVINTGGQYIVEVSKIIDLTGLTIQGCQESYANVAYQDSYNCTPTGTSVSVTYNLTDGTSVTKSGSVP